MRMKMNAVGASGRLPVLNFRLCQRGAARPYDIAIFETDSAENPDLPIRVWKRLTLHSAF
jgi:hypothetical protein